MSSPAAHSCTSTMPCAAQPRAGTPAAPTVRWSAVSRPRATARTAACACLGDRRRCATSRPGRATVGIRVGQCGADSAPSARRPGTGRPAGRRRPRRSRPGSAAGSPATGCPPSRAPRRRRRGARRRTGAARGQALGQRPGAGQVEPGQRQPGVGGVHVRVDEAGDHQRTVAGRSPGPGARPVSTACSPPIQLIVPSVMASAVASGSAAVWIRPLRSRVSVIGDQSTPSRTRRGNR